MNTTLESNIARLYAIRIAKWFMVYMPIIVLFFQENGLSLTQVMLVQATYSGTVALFEVPSGYWSDQIGRKKTLLIGMTLLTLYFSIYAASTHFYCFLIGAFTGGIGASCISGTDSALLYDTLLCLNRSDDYVKWEGRNYGIGTLAEALAAILGGYIADSYGLRFPVMVQVGITLLGLLAALGIQEPPRLPHKKTKQGFLAVLWTLFKERPALRYYMGVNALLGMASLLLAWLAQPYLKLQGVGLADIGWYWAFLNIIVAIGSFSANTLSNYLGMRKLSWLITTGFAIGLLVLGGLGHTFIIGATVYTFLYLLRGWTAPVFLNFINKHTPAAHRASVLSVRGLVIRLSYAVVAPGLGLVADLYTVVEAFLCLGLLFLLLLFIYYFTQRKI